MKNINLKKTGLMIFVFSLGLSLFAQTAPQASSSGVSSDYILGEDGKIRQRISWTRANAYFYEIEIEKLGAGAVWDLEQKTRTEQTFLELSLLPGMYRYRILSYNVLGRVGAASEWMGIRVFAAKQPGAESFDPPAYFVDSRVKEFTLTVRGRDLAEESLLHIVHGKQDAKPALPLSIVYSPDEDYLQAVLSGEGLEPGAYDIVITNPGGIRQILKGFYVGFTRPLDIAVSLGYTPFFPAYGYLFDGYTKAAYPLGFYARASVIPIKKLWGWIGFELGLDYTGLKTETPAYALSGDLTGVAAGGLFQKWFRDYTLAMNLRLGGGLSVISNIEFEHPGGVYSEEKTALLFSLNTAASAQWMVSRYFFLEGGAGFTQLVSSHSPAPGFFRLFAGAGARF